VLVAGTMWASSRRVLTSREVPCTTWPFVGETIESFAVLAGRAPRLGEGEGPPPPPQADAQAATHSTARIATTRPGLLI
jgi:hypothetical protein